MAEGVCNGSGGSASHFNFSGENRLPPDDAALDVARQQLFEADGLYPNSSADFGTEITRRRCRGRRGQTGRTSP